MREFRVKTEAQPRASLVAVGAKTILDESGPTKHRGRLLIHAGCASGLPELGGKTPND